MTRAHFETINAYFHIVTPQEETQNNNDPIKKVCGFYNVVKTRCSELYQPLQQLSVDKGMVKSKARTHFCQSICNKPTKRWFKFWILVVLLASQVTAMCILTTDWPMMWLLSSCTPLPTKDIWLVLHIPNHEI